MRNEYIGEKYNEIYDSLMKSCKARLLQTIGELDLELLDNQFRLAGERIKMEVAWRIFEEVNEENDLNQHIDLSCLDCPDAISISKQKIFDLA